ncbi:MAG: hypothetical protein RLZZ350_1530 [Verrucomicrobiota bacterium]|jgi:hypothetical protein
MPRRADASLWRVSNLISDVNLLPAPRSLKILPGKYQLPPFAAAQLVKTRALVPPIVTAQTEAAPAGADGYTLMIDRHGVRIEFREPGGLRAATATLRQLLREHGRELPCLCIRDWANFARRGVMLDISRGRVPNLATLLDLADKLADFKINELQLYTEHTFAYSQFKPVWRDWGALTAAEIRTLDTRCRELGIDLVPNQNSFGHLREFLAHPPLKKLAEVPAPYESATGDFLRHPSTLAPNHPGTLPFLRGLYDELLPNFSSKFFNVGCDETWDLGLGQSKKLCARIGQGRVYLDFLKKIHREVSRRGQRMMFWGDIILKYPQLIPELAAFGRANLPVRQISSPRAEADQQVSPTTDLIALNWGYEANHPFDREAALFAKSKIPFYVCPGTSTWMTLLGRHDNAFANLRAAARAGRKHGALGYLITDWGDGGHPQPLAVSWPLYAFGANAAWSEKSFDESQLQKVLSRDIFADPTQRVAKAALKLGFAHLKFGYKETNQTPFGAVIAAPPPERREMFCRNGLKYYARIQPLKIRAALAEVRRATKQLSRAQPATAAGKILARELEYAARMAAQSCQIMLWQQALAAGRQPAAWKIAAREIRELQKLEREFNAYWPQRNQGTTQTCSPFLQWRLADYLAGKLHFTPQQARLRHAKLAPAE